MRREREGWPPESALRLAGDRARPTSESPDGGTARAGLARARAGGGPLVRVSVHAAPQGRRVPAQPTAPTPGPPARSQPSPGKPRSHRTRRPPSAQAYLQLTVAIASVPWIG